MLNAQLCTMSDYVCHFSWFSFISVYSSVLLLKIYPKSRLVVKCEWKLHFIISARQGSASMISKRRESLDVLNFNAVKSSFVSTRLSQINDAIKSSFVWYRTLSNKCSLISLVLSWTLYGRRRRHLGHLHHSDGQCCSSGCCSYQVTRPKFPTRVRRKKSLIVLICWHF